MLALMSWFKMSSIRIVLGIPVIGKRSTHFSFKMRITIVVNITADDNTIQSGDYVVFKRLLSKKWNRLQLDGLPRFAAVDKFEVSQSRHHTAH